MSMSHNQMATLQLSPMIFGSLFVGASGSKTEGAGDFENAAEMIYGDGSNTESKDSDGDGLVDAVEAQYGTDPFDPDRRIQCLMVGKSKTVSIH